MLSAGSEDEADSQLCDSIVVAIISLAEYDVATICCGPLWHGD